MELRCRPLPWAVVLATLTFSATARTSDGADAAADDAPAPRRPNILLCIADDASWHTFGAYGCDWVRTPGFDRVAREGLLFRNAYTPNAKCAPSRASILTGRNSWQLEAAANHVPFFPAKFKVYTEALADGGYFVGKTAKGWAPGVARDESGGARALAGPGFESRTARPPARGIAGNDYAGNFADFLAACPPGRPWCFWYGALEPHRGYEYGAGVAKGGKRLADIDRVPAFWPDNEVVRNDMLDYAFELEHFDAHLVRMLATLESRGDLDDTLVVVTADNGMPFPRVKGQSYEPSNHVPLAVRWRRGIGSPGRVIDDHVSFVDLAPTFIEVAGLRWQDTGMSPSPGRSLAAIFASDRSGQVDATRDHVLIGKERHDVGRPGDAGYPMRGIVENGWLYLRNFEPSRWPAGNPETGYLNCDASPTKTEILRSRLGAPAAMWWRQCFGKRPARELYDIRADPDCVADLSSRPEHAERLARLEARLTAALRAQEDPRMEGKGAVFDAYPYADERHRGFYERYRRGDRPRAGWVDESDFETAPIPDADAER